MFAFTLLTANVARSRLRRRTTSFSGELKCGGRQSSDWDLSELVCSLPCWPVPSGNAGSLLGIVSGDLTQAPSAAFLFEVGTNTISGTTDFLSFIEPVPNCHFCVDFDSFAFTLPTNTKLADVSLSFGIDTNNVSAASSDFTLCTVMPCGGTLWAPNA